MLSPMEGQGIQPEELATDKLQKGDPSEAQVVEWWHRGAFRGVVTTQGRSLQVLYPGRPSAQAGPDFRDALLITEEGDFIRGDVEVHLKQGDWAGHGHHRDSRYNGVVLHLFLHGGGKGTPLEAGTQVPEVVLDIPPGPVYSRARPLAAPLERLRALPPGELGRALDEAGERRFMARAAVMLERLRGGDAEEELYAGLMEALGYSQNRAPMVLLARGLPLRQVKTLVRPEMERLLLALEATLLGAAGLLPHQRGIGLPGLEEERRSTELRELWRSMGEPAVVPQRMWANSSLRPQNRPMRRLVGASFLVGEYWDSGFVEGLRATLGRGLAEIEKGLEVGSKGFWTHHLDFHRSTAQAPALVGRGRAREMVINVVLPFFFAQSHLFGDRDLGRRALALYRQFPPAQDNEITREVKSLLATSRERRLVVNSAVRQQGLIHLYQVLRGQAR